MKIGSLFSGIGGLELGLEWAGIGQTAWQVESDEFCRSILEEHWPNADRSVTDVRECTRGKLAPVDIICGGFPCQDISVAGNGAGLAGKRSGLWFEFARIIGEFRPRYVVVENVAALLRRGLDTVLGTLAKLGYDAIWCTLRASDVGAPHKRERLFVLAYNGRFSVQRRREPEQLVCSSRPIEGEAHKRKRHGNAFGGGCAGVVAYSNSLRELQPQGSVKRIGRWARDGSEQREIESGVGRVSHGLPARVDRWPSSRGEEQKEWEPPRTIYSSKARSQRLKALGNAVVPQCAEIAGNVVLALENRGRAPEEER